MNINQKTFLISGLLLVVVVCLFGFLAKPLIKEIKGTSLFAEEENEKLIVLKNFDKEYLKKIESDYTKTKEDISAFKISLDDKQIVNFIVDLENLASKTSSNLEIKSAGFPVFDLSLTGGLPDAMKFLGWLENSDYFIDIESVQIRGLKESDLSSKEMGLFSIGEVRTNLKIKLPIIKNDSQ